MRGRSSLDKSNHGPRARDVRADVSGELCRVIVRQHIRVRARVHNFLALVHVFFFAPTRAAPRVGRRGRRSGREACCSYRNCLFRAGYESVRDAGLDRVITVCTWRQFIAERQSRCDDTRTATPTAHAAAAVVLLLNTELSAVPMIRSFAREQPRPARPASTGGRRRDG